MNQEEGALESLRATLPSLRIGGSFLPNRQVKLSIKGKLAWPGQGGGRKRLALVGNVANKLSTDFFPPKHIKAKKDKNVMQSSKEKQFL